MLQSVVRLSQRDKFEQIQKFAVNFMHNFNVYEILENGSENSWSEKTKDEN